MAIRGLYVITDSNLTGYRLVTAVEQAIAGGARIVQYRQKDRQSSSYLEDAILLRTITLRHQTTFIINDDPQLAKEVDADGVHIGRTDADALKARAIIGNDKVIGVSCYDDINLAYRAQQQGADYIAFGSFFESPVKPDAVKAPIQLIKRAKRELSLPVVAIGGIDQSNGSLLIDAGVDAIAVISAVFARDDIQTAAREMAALFDNV